MELFDKIDVAFKKHDLFLHFITITLPTIVSATTMMRRITQTPMMNRLKRLHT